MKICIWTTSLQANTLALAIAFDRDPSIELIVLTNNKAAYVSEPIFKFKPLNCVILDRDIDDYESVVQKIRPDIVYADNHIPPFNVPNKFLYHWHGLGWKTRPVRDLRAFHRQAQHSHFASRYQTQDYTGILWIFLMRFAGENNFFEKRPTCYFRALGMS